MVRRIDNSPVLSYTAAPADRGPAPFPLATPNASFWHSGQTAIWQGVRALGLGQGDRVLAPAYCCGSEVDALLKAGLTLDYYRIGRDLSPDLDHLDALCREPARALFLTHYFGVAQPMDALMEFAREHGLLVIEDNAHGLYSADGQGRPLGSLGDMAVFSFTKTLPLPDGGALVLRDGPGSGSGGSGKARDPAPPGERPNFGPVAGKLLTLVRRSAVYALPAAAEAARRAKNSARVLAGGDKDVFSGSPFSARRKSADEDIDYYLLDPGKASFRLSGIGAALLRRTDHRAVRDARRRNFELMAAQFEGGARARPLIEALPPGCSPWFFPVWVEEPLPLLRQLWREGVVSEVFWAFSHPAVPMAGFATEADLKRRCIEIPIHQSVDEDDVLRMAGILNRWNARPA